MPSIIHNRGLKAMIESLDNLRILLVDENHVPNKDQNFVNDVSANEVSGTGYARIALSGVSVAQDDTNDRATLNASDVQWVGLDVGRVAYGILYNFVTDDTDSPLIATFDIADVITNGTDITIGFNTNGLFSITQAP